MITMHLFDGPTGDQILDLTPFVRAAPIARGPHGDADLALQLALPSLSQQLALLERVGVPWVEVHDTGGVIWAGRLEDMQAASNGQPALTAYGPWRALDDVRITALWSDTRTEVWRIEEPAGNWISARWQMDNESRLSIAPQKNATYGFGVRSGSWRYLQPASGSRQILNVAFDYAVLTSNNFRADVDAYNEGFTSGVGLWSLAATGGTQVGSVCIPLASARDFVGLSVVCINGAGYTYPGETGAEYVRLTNVRITTQALAVSTTLTAGALLGATSIAVAAGTNITVGQSLYLGGTNPERVTVASVAGLTIGITPLAAAKSGGDTVRAQRVLVSDVASAIAATVSALNPAQLLPSTALIQASAVDRRDVIAQDQSASDLLEALAAEEQLVCGVSRERLLWLRPRDQAAWAQSYAVDAATITIGRTIEALRNQVIGVYEDPDGRPLRTAAATSAQSVARWALTRQAALDVQTTAVTQAEALRDFALADSDNPPSEAAIAFTQLWTLDGAPAALTDLAPGDTLTIRNLPLGTSADINKLSVVRVARTVFDPVTPDRAARLTVELENPPATLEVALARIALSYEPPAPRGLDKPLRVS